MKKKSSGLTCSSSTECDFSLILYCINGVCSCPSGYFFQSTYSNCSKFLNQTKSLFRRFNFYQNKFKKALYRKLNETCGTTLICDSTKGLSCSGGICSCYSTSFWNGSLCGKKLSISLI